LHTDAFPSQPLQGKRILRVFTNVNPQGKARLWRIGEPFAGDGREIFAARAPAAAGQARRAQGPRRHQIARTEYDHIMLRFHDLQKADLGYQKSAPQEWFAFPPGATWICFSDQVMHAVMEGQHLFEQTFYLPAEGQQEPEASPLRILEKMTGRRLAA